MEHFIAMKNESVVCAPPHTNLKNILLNKKAPCLEYILCDFFCRFYIQENMFYSKKKKIRRAVFSNGFDGNLLGWGLRKLSGLRLMFNILELV